MTSWEELYKSGLFKINTNQPSKLVLQYAQSIPENSRVVDLGCGNGRNSVYLASQNHFVDALDIINLDWLDNIDPELKKRILFRETDIKSELNIKHRYGMVLLIRLIQYLPPKRVRVLLKEFAAALEPGGLVIGSHNTWQVKKKGDYLLKIGTELYGHSPAFINQIAKTENLEVIKLETFKTVSQHVNYHSDIEVCEFVLRKN